MGVNGSSCSSCGAAIVWAVSDRGRRMPLDAQPQRLFTLDTELRPPACHSTLVYTSHFATCPNAAQHRSGS